MNFAIFQGEKNIKDLAKRLFGLSDKASKATVTQATDALLAANPQLQDMSKVPVGSVINVPASAPVLKPAEQAPPAITHRVAVAAQAQQTLDQLSQRLTAIDARVADSLTAFLKLAQSKEAQTISQTAPDLKEQLPALIASGQSMLKAAGAGEEARNQALAAVRAKLQTFAQGTS